MLWNLQTFIGESSPFLLFTYHVKSVRLSFWFTSAISTVTIGRDRFYFFTIPIWLRYLIEFIYFQLLLVNCSFKFMYVPFQFMYVPFQFMYASFQFMNCPFQFMNCPFQFMNCPFQFMYGPWILWTVPCSSFMVTFSSWTVLFNSWTVPFSS
jgi:hypothetical protein